MLAKDKTIHNLLELDGTRFVIDEKIGLWVKFEARQVEPTDDRPHGVKYSLSLHDRINTRVMGFDHAQAVEYGGKTNVAPKRTHYHWHRSEDDAGQPYNYISAAKLLEDFWFKLK
jgi:hypothetical protein